MCGIVGFNGPKDKKFSEDKIKFLLFYNQERGKDSLGFYVPGEEIYKETGKPEETMIKPTFRIPESSLFIGHVRAATVGVVNKNNAHPFQYGDLVLAMNGTLSNHWTLCTEYELDSKDYSVDTQVLAAIIAKTKDHKVLSKIIGGCAILFTDVKTNKLYVYRNSERPLYRGTLDGCIYISSIENSLKLINCSSVQAFKENYLYELEDGRVVKSFYVTPRKPEIKERKLMYEQNEKYNYYYKALSEYKVQDLYDRWFTPDNTNQVYGIRRGFSYRCIGQNKECSDHQITIINDLGEQVNVFKTQFRYHEVILSLGDYVFSTADLLYNKDPKDSFCSNGDLLKIIGLTSNGIKCKNLLNNKTATILEEIVRFGYSEEVKEFKHKYYINDEPEKVVDSKSKTETETALTEAEEYKKDLDDMEMADSFDQHADFVIDCFENLTAEMESLKMTNRNKQYVQKMKHLINFYKEGLPKYFDVISEEQETEEQTENNK